MSDAEKQPQKQSYEQAIVKALVVSAVVVVIGFLLATYARKMLAGDGKDDTTSYNGFEFTQQDGFWHTQWQRDGINYTLKFHYAPWEVENVTVQGQVDDRFKRWPTVFITFDPTDEPIPSTKFIALAAADTATFLSGPIFGRNVLGACTVNMTAACADRPIVTCSTNSSVVYLKVAEETAIILDGNCATFQGTEEGLRMASHKAIYQWLGIINT